MDERRLTIEKHPTDIFNQNSLRFIMRNRKQVLESRMDQIPFVFQLLNDYGYTPEECTYAITHIEEVSS